MDRAKFLQDENNTSYNQLEFLPRHFENLKGWSYHIVMEKFERSIRFYFQRQLFILTTLCISALTSSAGPLDHWKVTYTAPSVDWNHVVFAGGQFLTIGGDGSLATSPDGIQWTARNSGVTNSLHGAAYGNGHYIVVGENTDTSASQPGFVLASSDGVQWGRAASLPEVPSGAAYGNGVFVITGKSEAYRSSDGQTWESTGSPGTEEHNLAFQNGLFAFARGTVLYTSPDGVHWSDGKQVVPSGQISGIAYGNGLWVAIGDEYSTVSSDGSQWVAEAKPYPWFIQGLTFGQNQFVAAGASGLLFNSSTGSQWAGSGGLSLENGGGVAARSFGDIAYGNGTFVAIGKGWVLTSTDGIYWTDRVAVAAPEFQHAVQGNGKKVAVGMTFTTYAVRPISATLEDSGSWQVHEIEGYTTLTDVTYGKGRFVAVGFNIIPYGGYSTFSSPDGVSWSRTNWDGRTLGNTCFANDAFFVCGSNGTLLRSADGISWTPLNTGATKEIRGVAYGRGRYVAVGGFLSGTASDTLILTSTNGIQWEQEPQLPGYQFRGVAYGNGKFVAVRWIGTVVTSTDGLNWTEYHTPLDGKQLVNVQFGRGYFVVSDYPNGKIWTSMDGAVWSASPPPSPVFYYSADNLEFTGDAVTAVAGGSIWESDSIPMPYTVNVAAESDSFRIDRSSASANAFQSELQVPYSVAVTNADGTTLTITNVASIPEGRSTAWINVAPRQFSQAAATIFGGDNFEVGLTNRALISLSDSGLTPMFRPNGTELVSSNLIKLTLDARLQAKVQIEESSDMKLWVPTGIYTNTTGTVQIMLNLSTNETRHFYRAQIVE